METDIEFKFSKFSSDKPKCLYLKQIFNKYNLFKIKINNPLIKYIKGLRIIYDSISLNMLLKKKPLEKNDFRYFSNKLFNINTLEEACKILQILLNGSTVIYDDKDKKYITDNNSIDFYEVNGLLKNSIIFDDQNVYKTFIIK
jgi:hypothetical protein